MEKGLLYLTIFSGIWMIAQSLRFIVEYFIDQQVYKPILFDVFFDWTTGIILGGSLCTYGIITYYKKLKEQEQNKSISL